MDTLDSGNLYEVPRAAESRPEREFPVAKKGSQARHHAPWYSKVYLRLILERQNSRFYTSTFILAVLTIVQSIDSM